MVKYFKVLGALQIIGCLIVLESCTMRFRQFDYKLVLYLLSLFWFFLGGMTMLMISKLASKVQQLEKHIWPDGKPNTIKSNYFQILKNVEGTAMCTGCHRAAQKNGLYYNEAQDVYYHPECMPKEE